MPSLYESHVASVKAAREQPDYKARADEERTEFRIAADNLNDVCLKLAHLSGALTPDMTSVDLATYLEIIDAQLTVARRRTSIVRKAAKAIVARREREERGVSKP
jgi:hypothetical protein